MSRRFREEKIQLTDTRRELPGNPGVRTPAFTAVGLGSVRVRELRSHKPCGVAKEKRRNSGSRVDLISLSLLT